MKYNKIHNFSFDNKIFITCISIAVLTVFFYFINKQNKNRENMVGLAAAFGTEGPLDVTGTVATYAAADAMLTQALVQTNNDINSAITDSTIVAEATVTDALIEQALATILANQAVLAAEAQVHRVQEGTSTKVAGLEESIGTKIVDGANKVVGIAATGADIAATQAQNKADNARNTLTYYNQADWNKKTVGTMGMFGTMGFLGFLAASGFGAWAISNVNVLIYRITNFKSCFIWYFLELIGWILYLPIQFFVWLFCLQEFERNCWISLDALDCSIYERTGYYLFKHSDDVNKKCYSQVFTPFPDVKIPFNFDSLGNYMNNFDGVTDNLTSNFDSPDQVVADAEKALNDAQQATNAANDAQIAAQSLQIAQVATETALAMVP